MDTHVKRICITGPESTGKSMLAERLAKKYNSVRVPEYAREYLKEDPVYSYDDLRNIAFGQLASERNICDAYTGEGPVFLDTDLLTVVIWSKFVFGKVDADIYRAWRENLPGLYLLCDIDLPWEYDVLREHPHKREELRDIYLQMIEMSEVPYRIISGDNRKLLEL
jgi:nicotinamide riboside kinase